MTIEELQAQLTAMTAERDGLQQQLSDANSSGQTSAKQQHAMAAVLKAHNIAFDVAKADLGALSIADDGSVEGEFAYTPPAVQQQPPQPPQQPQQPQQPTEQTNKTLTFADIKEMSEDQINERWDEVSSVLAQKGEQSQ